MTGDEKKIVDFPKAEVSPEERARRLKIEVDRLASLPPVEWMLYLSEGVAEKHGVDRAHMKKMVEATIKDREKKAREDKADDRQREQRAERRQTAARRESKREQDEQRRTQERADKEAERKRKKREKEFEAIGKQPRVAHEARLAELAKLLDEDLELLRDEFEVFIGPESKDGLKPWDEPVETQALLVGLMAQIRRYVILHDDVAIAVALWVMFAWVHEIAVHSPLLIVTSAEADAGKTTLCGVLGLLTPRPYTAVELTGPNVYRIVDHLQPTLIIDEADHLFHRKTDLTHIVNSSWTRGTKIPRQVGGVIHDFDPFCPKIVAMKGLNLPGTTASRAIMCKLWPRLPSEHIEDFRHVDDDDFVTLRRKALRWAADNAAPIKDTNPNMPPGFGNRPAANWRVLLAIADLAGGSFPKRARVATIKLSNKRHQPSEGIRLLAKIRSILSKHEMIASDELVKLLTADKEDEWCDFRDHGPISKRQIAILLDAFDIHPDVIHPRSGESARGYKTEWFAHVFARYLPANRTTVHQQDRKTRQHRKTRPDHKSQRKKRRR